MKKLNLLFAFLLALTIISCKDDEDKGPTFKKEDFYAVWQKDGTQGLVLYKWDANGFYIGTAAGGTQNFGNAIPYTFDGKKTFTMTISGTEYKYVITSKTATTFKAIPQAGGQKGPEESYTKI